MDVKFITVKEAAEVLRMSKGAVYSMAATGTIPSIRLGRSVRIPANAIDNLLNAAHAGAVQQ